MKKYDPNPKSVLAAFDTECQELAYSDAMPVKVSQLRKELKKFIEKQKASYVEAEKLKSKFMRTLMDSPEMDRFDWKRYTTYMPNGEPRFVK